MKQWVDLGLSYEQAAHGMQTGVAYDLQYGSESGSPKHLRVGVNSSMSDHAALAYLLIKKGIFTEEEYVEAVRLAMNQEVDRYERLIGLKVGAKVTLR